MKRKSVESNHIVYIHRNKINNKVYVGQTYNLYERWRCNGKNYFNSIKFYNAILKYGWDNFTHEIICDNLSQEAADILEKELIIKYNSIKNGYNIKSGGYRGELSEESLKKMSISLKKGYIDFPERKEKIRKKKLGTTISEETKRKMCLNNSKSCLININGEIGSLRYWANKVKSNHVVLSYRLKKYGVSNLIEWIKEREVKMV